jgi:predicted transcriptional regulator
MKPSPTALGRLEIAVLDRLWDAGQSDVASMHAAIGAPRGLARNTIQSTLERLVRKGLAERSKKGRAYAYRARITRAQWLSAALTELTDRVPGVDPPLLISSFVDFAERTGMETLEELESLVRQRRREIDRENQS